MLRKTISILLIVGCISGIYISYILLDKKTHLNSPVVDSIPADAALILHLKTPLATWSSLAETNLIWESLKSIQSVHKTDLLIKSIDSTLQAIGIQKEREVVFSIHQGIEHPAYLVSFPSEIDEFNLIVNKLKAKKHLSLKQTDAYRTTDDYPIYICYSSPFTIISTNENTIQKSLSQLSKKSSLLRDSAFNELYQKNKSSKNSQIYYNSSNLKKVALKYFNKKTIENWEQKQKWTTLDIIIGNNQLLLNGLSILDKTSSKNASPTKRIPNHFLPKKMTSILERSFNIETIPNAILNSLNNNCNCNIASKTVDWVGNHITEITFDKSNIEKAYYIETKEKENLIEEIKQLVKVDSSIINSYGIDIYKLKSTSLNLLLELKEKEIYFCIHDSQLVISTLQGLKKLSFEWKENEYKKSNSNYTSFSEEYLAQKASFNFFSNSKLLAQQIKQYLKPQYYSTLSTVDKELVNDFLIGYQTNILSKNLEHNALIIKTKQSKSSNKGELWSLTLANKTNSIPQLLKNHKSKSLDIFIQDTSNTIYLINAAGSIKWSKSIKGEIIGKIQQIDVYGNNKFQALFNTESQIHLIDINGNYVSGFPVKLDSKATSPVSIFDYDNTNNYRFWISCKNLTTYNYDKEGKKVTGWNLPKSKFIIKNKFQRAVFNRKDYIYSNDIKGNVIFLNRRGEKIYNIKAALNAQDGKLTLQKRASLGSSSFIYQDDSTKEVIDYSLNNISQKIELDKTNSDINYKILDLDNNKFIDYLSIYQNKIEVYGLDKSIISRKEQLYNVEDNHRIIRAINNENYILIRDENSNQLFILDSHLMTLNKIELEGSLNTTIGDINSDGIKNVITIINNETIKVYRLN
jgi:hypothetical protein